MTITRLVPGVALILAGAIVFGYVVPTYSGPIAVTKAALLREQSALDAAKSFGAKNDALTKAKNDISQTNRDRLDQLLPSSVNSVAVILDLTALATRTGIRLSSINAVSPTVGTPTAVETSDAVGSMDLTLTAAGTYQGFHAFLEAIERSAEILDVTDISVKTSDTGVYTYDLKLRLYWLH